MLVRLPTKDAPTAWAAMLLWDLISMLIAVTQPILVQA